MDSRRQTIPYRNYDVEARTVLYNGQVFRSALEARWACFFSHLNIRYLYEPTTFKGAARWYKPDFFLPELHNNGVWFEVKPTDPTIDELGLARRASRSAGLAFLISNAPFYRNTLHHLTCNYVNYPELMRKDYVLYENKGVFRFFSRNLSKNLRKKGWYYSSSRLRFAFKMAKNWKFVDVKE